MIKIMENWIWKQEKDRRMDDCLDNGSLDFEMDVLWCRDAKLTLYIGK